MDIGLQQVLVLCAFAFLAGGLDAVVGGGGLVQLPALLVMLPQAPVVSLLGTNKLASVVGTGSAAVTYIRRVTVDRRTAGWMAGSAFVGAGAGALLATRVGSDVLKPLVLVALVAVLAYTLAGLALARSRLRLSILAYEISPGGMILGLLVFAPFVIGLVTACTLGWGGAAGLIGLAIMAVKLDVEIVAWTSRAVAIRWKTPTGDAHRAWVWASAVER